MWKNQQEEAVDVVQEAVQGSPRNFAVRLVLAAYAEEDLRLKGDIHGGGSSTWPRQSLAPHVTIGNLVRSSVLGASCKGGGGRRKTSYLDATEVTPADSAVASEESYPRMKRPWIQSSNEAAAHICALSRQESRGITAVYCSCLPLRGICSGSAKKAEITPKADLLFILFSLEAYLSDIY